MTWPKLGGVEDRDLGDHYILFFLAVLGLRFYVIFIPLLFYHFWFGPCRHEE